MWPSPPGALRVRPLPRETAASYLTRLAAAYHLSPAHLLDGLHITTTGTPAAPHTTELHYSCEATRRLASFTRIPPAHLDRALTRRPPTRRNLHRPPPPPPTGSPSPPPCNPLPACTACTLRRPPHHAAPRVEIHPPPDLPPGPDLHPSPASLKRPPDTAPPSTSAPCPNSPTPAPPPTGRPPQLP
ncbi:TniQ family protein [Streptomyces sp. RS2]|uniref:TniQ family protein n=1 Tax=Streptomyces sp. RS2 TaxID=1451205 RepID=UPI0021F89455|nr:TniQ family protein [Streptomyces sp. RS2]MCW1100011.1 TniQ family protein [Streptomyces sp. RS2]